MSQNDSNILDLRLSEAEVARVLLVIASPPNQRRTPLPGDLEGQYDFWFDGGACAFITGTTHYVFKDGTEVWIGVLPVLSMQIQFPDGRSVAVRQAWKE